MVLIHWLLFLAVLGASTVTSHVVRESKRNNSPPNTPFVTIHNGQFFVNGSAFKFVGTTAYWLAALNNEKDIDDTLAAIKRANFTVVRTWAFNDIDIVPENYNGTWFQTVQDGKLVINEGPNGLQRLDKVIELAQKHGLFVLLSLTNNWNPARQRDQPLPPGANPILVRQLQGANGNNQTLPPNYLSNDYGGMDFYVRNLNGTQEHDQFFTNETLIEAFSNYTTRIASRYSNHTNVFSWELANDPRCNSTISTSAGCEARNITRWHSTLAEVVKKADPNHVVSSGAQGFFCTDCPKLFPRATPPSPPPPQGSPAPGARRRSQTMSLSKKSLLDERKAAWKRERERQRRAGRLSDGTKIRGRWTASPAKRQSNVGRPSLGPAFDGSAGVDSEDILNIDTIGFTSAQLFPDQEDYSNAEIDEDLPFVNKTLLIGLQWLERQGTLSKLFKKPVLLIAFGVVTSENLPFFVPFNLTTAPFGPDQVNTTNVTQPATVTNEERDEIYKEWIKSTFQNGLLGAIHYQWSQPNLTTIEGTAISPNNDQNTQSPTSDTTGISPNDGYGTLGQGEADTISSIQQGFQPFAPDSN